MSTQFKVVLLGEGRVGKTSILRRYVYGDFSDTCAPTRPAQGNMFSKKKLVVDETPVTINIWDTAGQEKFIALGPIYYRDSQGALLVYDITDADTFGKVKMWIRELKKVVGDNIVLAVAGNKCDLERQRAIPLAEALAFCSSVGATHYDTSAKTNRGIEEVFTGLTTAILRVRNTGSLNAAGGAGMSIGAGPGRPVGGQRKGLIVGGGDGPPTVSLTQEKKDMKGCCG
eukprot:TRINITY_DN22033_c0_g1_i1.p2 TRINITY_DN22033_c0_g1~~TRINITY_DN22033_c0_g1_i1.p2  ORF type:complete len:228 (+),score=49.45 TRINITY_DN22033_c0_g1_i1:281-964(+)